jgi:membrane-associated protein
VTSVDGISDTLLGLLPTYGYYVVGASAFAGAAGLPVPVSVLLLAAGALTAEGVLDYLPVVLAALLAAVFGDCAAYALGRVAGRPLLERAGLLLRISPGAISAAERGFGRWGGGAVWITRWLLTAAGPIVSILADTERYPFRSFVLFSFTGEAIWASGYAGLGWLFGDNWDALLALLESVGWIAAAVAAAVALAVLAWRQLHPQGQIPRLDGAIGGTPPA